MIKIITQRFFFSNRQTTIYQGGLKLIIKILFNYIMGYVNITIEGFFVERFINHCINNKIFLWSTKRSNATLLSTNVSIKQFKEIRGIAKRTKCKVKINYKKGLPILLHKYRKRKLLLFLLIPIVVAILITSTYIWNIEIEGIEKIERNEILRVLSEEGIDIGKRKGSIDTKTVINNIRLKRDDISWMSIDMKGTNIIVSIVEAKEKPEIINEKEYCNIVSDQKGIITKITADTGTALAKVGDIVEKGDILIAGYMEGKYTGIRYVHAKGNVEARVWDTKRLESGFTREIIEETGVIKNRYSINFNNFKINLYKSLPNFENYDTINEINKIKLFNNFYLPIEIIKTTYVEQKKTKITYGKEELKEILIEELGNQFEEENISNLDIINKIVNVYEKESSIEVEMTYEVQTNIGIEEGLVK